ncbi:CpaF family protein [Roseococcus sp.]|uniref:CpaF family protein n=1 Tax=Roseococcus sp. TaxID=2109646 RepID=UPI003BAD6497
MNNLTPPTRPEPVRLSDQYQQIQAEAFRLVLDRLERRGISVDTLSRHDLRHEVTTTVTSTLELAAAALNGAERARMTEELLDEILGYGPLEPLLNDSTVDDIIVNGPKRIYVERGGVLQRVPIRFRDDAHLMAVIQRIVGPIGRRVDEASPYCDARLPDGSRVNIVVPPIAIDGPAMSIRKSRRVMLGAMDLVRRGLAPREALDYLAKAVRARLNMLIIGGTGSGKTTLLNVLSAFIHHSERLVTIEDAAELQLRQDHVVRLETRPPSADGRQAVLARDLVRNALRMRPDRIILGEVRGTEAVEMLQAMSTGHDGSMSTLHANGPRDALARIEMLLAFSGLPIEPRAMRRFISSSINIIAEVRRLPDGRRRLMHISEVLGVEEDTYRIQDVFQLSEEEGAPPPQMMRSAYAARLQGHPGLAT